MKILVSLGPFIGLMVYVAYCTCIRLYVAAKGREVVAEKQKKIYIPMYILAAVEVVLMLITIIVPRVSDESYVIGSIMIGGKSAIIPSKFKVSYIESGRNYSDRIKLNEAEMENIRAVCSSEEGTVFLRITQEDIQETVDITNEDILLDMSEFEAGYIRFTLLNEDARNVKFELIW